MTIVERLRERMAAYYGSQHEELRRVLDMAIARIEAADRIGGAEAVERAYDHAKLKMRAAEKAAVLTRINAMRSYRAIAREQDKEWTHA